MLPTGPGPANPNHENVHPGHDSGAHFLPFQFLKLRIGKVAGEASVSNGAGKA